MPQLCQDESSSSDPRQFLCVRVGGGVLKLAIQIVAAVSAPGPLAQIPGAPPWLCGLMAHRGRLLTLVDAGLAFGQGRSTRKWVVILRGVGVDTSLAVDSILELSRDSGTDEAAHYANKPQLIDGSRLRSLRAFNIGIMGWSMPSCDELDTQSTKVCS
ncbi:MAG: chemotaxis protein CheW [Planctomycetota bacterium]